MFYEYTKVTVVLMPESKTVSNAGYIAYSVGGKTA